MLRRAGAGADPHTEQTAGQCRAGVTGVCGRGWAGRGSPPTTQQAQGESLPATPAPFVPRRLQRLVIRACRFCGNLQPRTPHGNHAQSPRP